MPTNINNQALLKYFKNHAVCTRCVKNCTKISGTICCKLCQRWYHTTCKKGEGRSYIPESSNFNCKECTSSFLPFFEVDDIDFFCALYGDGTQPCKRCHRDCLDTWLNCFQCNTCREKFHSVCTFYDNAFCSKRRSTGIFPFSETDYDSLVLDSILTKNIDEDIPEPSKVVTKMKEKVTKHVPLDHFYDIDCSYLNPMT